YAVALLEGKPAAQRLRFACAAAGASVQCKGARPSLPSRRAVEQILAGAG
ncbi:MAG: ribokinase, partial [Planctomycetes bacterium]|nr:ribokinase [Planctomycetota bacterium]